LPQLRRSLGCTNAIESANGACRTNFNRHRDYPYALIAMATTHILMMISTTTAKTLIGRGAFGRPHDGQEYALVLITCLQSGQG
jgi:hypothetical protein